MRIAVKLLCIGVIIGLSGCSSLSSLNPFAEKNEPRNPPAQLEDFKASLEVRTVWSNSIGDAGTYIFSPVSINEKVFAASADGTVARIDLSTGRVDWRINAGMPLTAGVGSDGATIAVVGHKGVLITYDKAGQLRWKVQLSSEVLSSPVVGQGLVIVRGVDNRIAAYDVESGARRWVIQRNLPPLILRTAPGIIISNSNAFVALPGGKLIALALNNGASRWEAVVGEARGATELERIADVSGTPVLLGREVCAVAYQGRIACFDVSTGAPIWAKEFSSNIGVGADDQLIYSADERDHVIALARDTGSRVWRNNKLAYRRLSAPVPLGRAVALGDANGYIHFLSREDGSFLARISTDGSPIISSSLVYPGASAIFQTRAGTLAMLKIQ